MPEVKTILPQRRASQHVHVPARRALGEASHGHGRPPLQHAREAAPRAVGGRRVAQPHGTRDVRGAAAVLAAAVAEVQAVGMDGGGGGLGRRVVNDGRVGVDGGDGLEGRAHEVALLAAEGQQALGGGPLRQRLARRHRALQPAEVAAERCRVAHVYVPHGGQLGLRLDGLHGWHGAGRPGNGGGGEGALHGAVGGAGVEGDGAERGGSLGEDGHGGCVGSDLNACCLQRCSRPVGELRGVHEEGGCRGRDQQVAHEHWIVVDVAAAQIERPRDFIQRSQQHAASIDCGADSCQLVSSRHARDLHRMVHHRLALCDGLGIAPHLVHKVVIQEHNGAAGAGDGALPGDALRHGAEQRANAHPHW
mmetsp:Transcript_14947/g.47656  ORF Transcript_14947/g.47656 Transcript_14947/m.47656 type:complete len:363 (+) Transcript_14947:466-1554(+)